MKNALAEANTAAAAAARMPRFTPACRISGRSVLKKVYTQRLLACSQIDGSGANRIATFAEA